MISSIAIYKIMQQPLCIKTTFVQNYFIYINQMAPSDSHVHADQTEVSLVPHHFNFSQNGPPKTVWRAKDILKIKLLELIIVIRFTFSFSMSEQNTQD